MEVEICIRDMGIRQHSKKKTWAGNFGGRKSLPLDLNSCQLDDVYLVICISRIDWMMVLPLFKDMPI